MVDKVMMPQAFNQLRRTLHDDFPALWYIVGGMMVHDHERLIEYMNAALGTTVQPHTHDLEQGCIIWQKELDAIKRKGSKLSSFKLPDGRIYLMH